MKQKILLLVAPLLLASGCLSYNCGYADKEKVISHKVDSSDLIPLSYSVHYSINWMGGEGLGKLAIPKEAKLRQKTQAALSATQLFSPLNAMDDIDFLTGWPNTTGYHFAFRYNLNFQEDVRGFFLFIFSFYLIPALEEQGLDGSVTVFYDGVPIYSSVAAEKVRTILWLPLIGLGSPYAAYSQAVNHVVNNLVNDAAAFHRKRFLSE